MLASVHAGNNHFFPPVSDVVVGDTACPMDHAFFVFARPRPVVERARILLSLLRLLLAKRGFEKDWSRRN